ncbi:MAG: amidohydrolase family protein [Pseudomonadota bacterium]
MSEQQSSETFPIVDAHHHFWDPTTNYHPWLCDEPPIPFRYGDYRSLRVPYLPPAYFDDAGHHDIVKTVYIETEWDPADPIGELRWVEQLHAACGHPGAVVAQAWLDREDVDEVLAAVAASPLARSVRHKPRAAARAVDARRGEPGSMDDPRWRAGFAKLAGLGLMFDLQTPWWHLEAALELARDFPATTLVVNHAGLPSDRTRAGLDGWHQALAALADAPNVMIKISGIGVPGEAWTAAANRWIVREIVAMFGPARCMFASNFPVDGLCGTFVEIFDGFRSIVSDFEPADQRALFHDNAMRVYRPV